MSGRSNLFTRPDTFFGVCEAVGQDLGFNANWLRVGLALPLLYAPLWSVAAYLVLAVLVVASRLLFPARAAATAPEAVSAVPVSANDADAVPLAQAA